MERGARLKPWGLGSAQHGACQPDIFQFLTGRNATQHEAAATHVPPPDKFCGKAEAITENVAQHVTILWRGDATEEHNSAIRTEPAGKLQRIAPQGIAVRWHMICNRNRCEAE